MPSEATRGAVHAVGAGATATFPAYLALPDVVLLGAVFSAFLSWTYARGAIPSVHAVRRASLGALVFPIGLTAAAAISWTRPSAFSYGALVLALADPLAAYAGRTIPSPQWHVPGGSKSLAGSLTFFAVVLALGTLVALIVQDGVAPGALIAVAAVLTTTEALLGYGLDNLPVPILAAALGAHALGF